MLLLGKFKFPYLSSLIKSKSFFKLSRVVEGKSVLQKIEELETYNNRPNKLCQISNAGVLTELAD